MKSFLLIIFLKTQIENFEAEIQNQQRKIDRIIDTFETTFKENTDDFEERFVLLEKRKMTSSERVYSVIERSLVKLAKSDIMVLCPELSQKTIERALKKLTDEGKIAKIGGSKNTTYVDVKRL